MTDWHAVDAFGRWVLERSGVSVLGLLALLAGLTYPLSHVHVGLSGSIVFAAYLAWLLAVFATLREQGRSWSRSSLAWAPFALLLAFALLMVPRSDLVAGVHGPSKSFAVLALLSYVFIWDHVAISLVRGIESRWIRTTRYAATMLVSFMPPFAILWTHYYVRVQTDAKGDANSAYGTVSRHRVT